MTSYAVEFSDEAWGAIEAQIHYIAIEKQAPESAARWCARLLAAIDALEQLPKRYSLDARRTAVVGVEVRRVVFERTWLLFYTVDDRRRRVVIVSFRHGARRDAAS